MSGATAMSEDIAGIRAELKRTQEECQRLRNLSKCNCNKGGSLRVSTPCSRVEHTEWEPHQLWSDRQYWQSWCPCCRHPLDVTMFVQNSWYMQHDHSYGDPPHSFAYAIALWGDAPGFVLGALVLGQALIRTGAKYDRDLIYTDIHQSARALLSNLWIMKRVKKVDSSEALFHGGKSGRFEGVFNKLHVFSLVEYQKVLMLDIDITVFRCPDELFKLPAPAAMRRGHQHHEHGSLIDGRTWFSGEGDWYQCGGINAGVMLLEPNLELHARVLREVCSPEHPEHIAGNGPEQDYLSRLFAPSWHHISVEWNWQLHQMFFALDVALEHQTKAETKIKTKDDTSYPNDDEWETWVPDRISTPVAAVNIVHFSGDVKIWDRVLQRSTESDAVFADTLMKDNNETRMWLFAERAGTAAEYSEYGLQYVNGAFRPTIADTTIQTTVDKVRCMAIKAIKTWQEDLDELLHEWHLTQEGLVGQLTQIVPAIEDGSTVTCLENKTPIWETPWTWNEVGELNEGDSATATGPAECHGNHWFVRLCEPQGIVELRLVQVNG